MASLSTSSSTNTGPTVSDESVQKKVLAELKWDARVSPNADNIELSVSKGWVTLEGDVEWNYQKTEAERVVRNLRGVKGVTNLLTVKPHVKPDELKDKIESALIRSAKTDARNITVQVEGSKAILKGKVRSFSEKEDAERAAWLAPGVSSVESRLTVAYV